MDRNAKKGTCSNCKVCKAYLRETGSIQAKHVLSIRWQPDYSGTDSSPIDKAPDENDIRSAITALKTALAPKGVQVVLEIFPPTAAGPPRKTVSVNGIWIGARALESWLKPTTRQNDHVTKITEEIFIEGKKPALTPIAEMVFKAGLLASKKLLQTEDEISGCPAD